jgi:hypothetical protein
VSHCTRSKSTFGSQPITSCLDTQGLQSPASRLSSPLDLTVANSAPGHYSCYWAYSPCADHHKLLLVNRGFFAINSLISWTLKY